MAATNSSRRLPPAPSEAALVLPDRVVIREHDPVLDYDGDDRPTDPGRLSPALANHGLLRTRPRYGEPEVAEDDERPTMPPPPPSHNERRTPVAIEIGLPLFTEAAFARPAERSRSRGTRNAPTRSTQRRWLPWILTGALILFSALGWSAIQRATRSTSTPQTAPRAHVHAR